MAVPTVVAVSGPLWVTSGSVAPALPTGWQAGDLLIAAVVARSSSTDPVIDLPSGWTNIGYSPTDGESDVTGSLRVMGKVATSGETATTFVSNITATNPTGAYIVCVRGADLATVARSTLYFTTGTNAGSNPVTSVSADNLLLLVGGIANDVLAPVPTGWASILSGTTIAGTGTGQVTAAGGDAAMVGCYLDAPTAGTYDPPNVTLPTTPNIYISYTLALPPGAAPGTPGTGALTGTLPALTGSLTGTSAAPVPPFTTDFTGSSSLPTPWVFDSPLGDGSVTVSGSRASITMPAARHDSISTASNADESVGIKAALPSHSGDVDVAVQVDTDVSDLLQYGVNLICTGSGTDAARFGWYHDDDADNEYPKLYGYLRAGGVGASPGNVDFTKYMTGIPSWLRIRYVSSTGTWTALHSADGVTWAADYTRGTTSADFAGVRTFTPTDIKIGVTQGTRAGSAYVSRTVSVNQVVDLLALGSTDVREAAPTKFVSPKATITGDEGILPSGWANDSVTSGTVTFPTGLVRLFENGATDATTGSRAAIGWTGTKYRNAGLLLQVTNSDADTDFYFTASLGDGSAQLDQYVNGSGYGLEVQSGQIRRPIRVNRNTGNVAPASPYPTGLNEVPYCHLADKRAEYDMGLGGTRWFRMERVGRRYRVKEWADGASEPTTWDLFDGQDEVHRDLDLAPYISLSHNSVRTGTATFDLGHVEFYELTDTPPVTAALGGALPALTASLTGQARSAGTITSSLPALTGSLTGAARLTGALLTSLPPLAGALAGTSTTTSRLATLSATLPKLTGSLTGSLTGAWQPSLARVVKVSERYRVVTVEGPAREGGRMADDVWVLDPDKVDDNSVDWRSWLATRGDAVASVQWFVPEGMTKTAEAVTDGGLATVWLTGGVLGRDYVVTARLTTTAGRVDDRSALVLIRPR